MDKDPDYVFKFPDPEDQVSAPPPSPPFFFPSSPLLLPPCKYCTTNNKHTAMFCRWKKIQTTCSSSLTGRTKSVHPSSASMMCHSITPHLPHPPHLQLGSDPLFHRTFDIKPCTSFPHAPLLVFRRPHTLPQPQLRSRSGEPLVGSVPRRCKIEPTHSHTLSHASTLRHTRLGVAADVATRGLQRARDQPQKC